MPKLGSAALLKAKAEGSSTSGGRKAGTFTPLFKLKVGESAFIKFVDDELWEGFMHTFVKVPSKSMDRDFSYEHFVSRSRNAEFGEEFSLLEDELDHWPIKKIAGIIVLLEPEYKGTGSTKLNDLKSLTVAGNTVSYDNGDVFYPNWQLVFEAYGSFWENLVGISNDYGLTEYPLKVTRVASDSYQFVAVTHGFEFDEEMFKNIPTIDAEIKRLGSQERYDEYFGKGKKRINQDQKHHYLPDWLQKERKESLGISGDDEEIEETPKPARKTGQRGKSRVDFDDIKVNDDEEAEVEPYTT